MPDMWRAVYIINRCGNIKRFHILLDNGEKIFKEKKPLSSNILQLSNKVGMYSNDQFILFLLIIKFIIVHTTKINLGIDIQKNFISDISKSLLETSKYLDNKISQKILDYLNILEFFEKFDYLNI